MCIRDSRVAAAEVDAHVAVFAERLASYPQWPELDGLETCPACAVPGSDRPAHAVASVGAR